MNPTKTDLEGNGIEEAPELDEEDEAILDEIWDSL